MLASIIFCGCMKENLNNDNYSSAAEITVSSSSTTDVTIPQNVSAVSSTNVYATTTVTTSAIVTLETNITSTTSQSTTITKNPYVDYTLDTVTVLDNHKKYESWPKVMYDEETENLLTVYSSGIDHANNYKDIYLAIYNNGDITYRLIDVGNEYSLKPIGIFKYDSQYVIFATCAPYFVDYVKTIYRYVSDDLNTWVRTTVNFPFNTDLTGAINIDNVRIIEERVFANLSYYENGKAYICYSDDYGLTWERTAELEYDSSFIPCECAFFKINERIIILGRKDIPISPNPTPLYFSYSDDNGETWSKFVDTEGITNANSSNLSIIEYCDGKIAVIFASRHSESPGVYLSLTNFSDAYNGIFENPIKLNDGYPNADFGYPNAAKAGESIFYAYYSKSPYDDGSVASIYINWLNIKNAYD